MTDKKKTYFVSTAIPYVNGEPHVGHALEYVQTDVLARHYREQGYAVHFNSGTDENALKNVQTAEKEGITVQEVVDKYSKPFADFEKLLNISFDKFVRTSEEYHHVGSQEFWKRCKNDIYKKEYEGKYCVGCEEFKTEKDLDEEGFCPEHKKKPELVKEENYFFKLSNYQDFLDKLISTDKLKITPEERKNEVLSFIRGGLQDFSVSRSKKRAKGWGIPVPGDKDQYIYVWFDALINYITGLGYPREDGKYAKFWSGNPNRVHVIGKGISRFHAVYWPAMLKSAALPVPTAEFIHGYITIEGEKISKSLGNVIKPKEVVEKYGIDPFRYYLLKEINPFKDGDFSWSRFTEVYNSDLANGIGNLVQRVSKLCERNNIKNEELGGKKKAVYGKVQEYTEKFEFHLALEEIWNDVREADKIIDETKPWTLEGHQAQMVLMPLIKHVRNIAKNLMPFMPDTAEKILEVFDKEIKAPSKALFPRIK